MSEMGFAPNINFNQADIDINNDYIKKINKQIVDLNKRKAKYQNKNKEIKKGVK